MSSARGVRGRQEGRAGARPVPTSSTLLCKLLLLLRLLLLLVLMLMLMLVLMLMLNLLMLRLTSIS